MQIWIRNDCQTAGVDEAKFRRRAQKLLSALGCDEAELSVWLCDDPTIQALHRDYLGRDLPTNVISFGQREGEFADLEPEILGDVVISVDTARRDSQEAGQSLDDEIAYLLIHGVLHLLGYDHEDEQGGRSEEMEAREAELFRLVLDET